MQEVVHIKDYMFPNDIWQSSPERRAGRRKWKKAGADYLRPQTHLLDCQTQKMLHRGGEGPRCEGNLRGPALTNFTLSSSFVKDNSMEKVEVKRYTALSDSVNHRQRGQLVQLDLLNG